MPHQFIPMLPSILKPSRLARNLPSHKQITKNLKILQYQIHLMLKLQGLHKICCKFQERLMSPYVKYYEHHVQFMFNIF